VRFYFPTPQWLNHIRGEIPSQQCPEGTWYFDPATAGNGEEWVLYRGTELGLTKKKFDQLAASGAISKVSAAEEEPIIPSEDSAA
jgi:hypothetical protein